MQKYIEITEDTPIEDSREMLLNNDKTVASHYAGTAFPTENLVVGMECYRTDENRKYRLTSLSPVRWEAVLSTVDIAKIKVDNAAHADEADSAKACSGNAVTATKLQTARAINGVVFDGTKNITVTAAANGGNADTTDGKHATDAAGQIALKDGSNDLNCRLLRATYANQNTISGAIAFRVNNSSDNYTRYCSDAAAIRNFLGLGNVNNTADANKSVNQAKFLRPDTLIGTNAADLIYARMAESDYFRIRVGGTGSNAGYAEIATADDGTEPIYVRQYTGAFATLTRTATLLDGSGNTNFPGTVSAPNITAANGRLEATGTSSNLPQVLLHIPNVRYSRLRMSTDGVIHAQDGGSDAYVNMKAANFIGNLSGNAATATKATQDSGGNVITGTYKRKNYTCTNFNSALTDGQYHVGGTNITGAPYTGNIYGVLLVYLNDGGTHNNSNNWIWQQFYDTGGRYYFRYKVNSGGWTAWVLIATNGNIRYADTAGNANKLIGKNWYWSGQGGQPTWLWGGSDGTNMYVYNPSNFNVASATKLSTARKINGVAFDGTKDITINAGGISTSSNITVTASTQGALNFSGSISKGQVTGLKQATGLAAGTYTLQNLLQQIVNRTHTHSLATINCNCDCNCSDDGE